MKELHPYGEFIPPNATSMIIGSFPIGKFTDPKRRHEIKSHEFDFFFGGEKNLFWKLLGHVFKMPVKTKEDLIHLLTTHHLAMGDCIRACERKNGGASDSDLYNIVWNTKLLEHIDSHEIKLIFFTSKKVESWFNRLFPQSHHLQKICLVSPSAQSLRGLGANKDFQSWRQRHPEERSVEFIFDDYEKKFLWVKGQLNRKDRSRP